MPEAVLHIERERRLNEFYDYMRMIDEAVVHYISKMKISGVLEPCFFIVRFRFQRSGFSSWDIEIVDERLLHFPNDLPIGRRPIDSNMAM